MQTTQSEIARGQNAVALQENPLLAESLAAWEEEITKAWKQSPIRDVEGREKLRLMLEAARQFQAHIQKTVDTGKMAQIQMEQLRPRFVNTRRAA